MSAILSADDLNDFINPGVACIKPVETLPKQQPPPDGANPYEVTTEDKVDAGSLAPPAQISLTDCLACSGCVTSAEAILVSLQSHAEVLDTLDRYHELPLPSEQAMTAEQVREHGKIFVASISPQARASLAATYNVSEREAGHMISQLLSGPLGLRSGGKHCSGFAWVLDTNVMRNMTLVAAADEVDQIQQGQKKPVITSACPGWICYAEKTHSHILPHLSRLKSPQALTGVLIKSVLAKKYGIDPSNVWHLAVMPCFDKKLEASRSELTSHTWHGQSGDAVRDVDCVITARELLMLAESRDISFPGLPKHPVADTPEFPEPSLHKYLFEQPSSRKRKLTESASIGTSGGYLWHVLRVKQTQHAGSQIKVQRGRNQDVSEYSVVGSDGSVLFKAARYYGFRNIQNLVRKLKPAKASRLPGATTTGRRVGGARRTGAAKGGDDSEDYAYVEVMACPGGCTNGGGQIKVGDAATLRQVAGTGIENGGSQVMIPQQREWLATVDEAYWSAGSSDSVTDGSDTGLEVDAEHSPARDSVISSSGESADVVDGIDHRHVHRIMDHWSSLTGVELDTLLTTTYRVVESDVGKDKPGADVDRVNALAAAAGGGW
ncbi:Putative Iron hydrogenase, large subunit [Septoria linicola]|uniref:Nuclear architecture-related protein 1 n=1 Tax=Septoria linicola TaxID=215465 RepID=A0A9Q9AJB8_9PEZI|nr:putative Iron hydrogenase, large subunit [Septoria linicola]USW47500.1 Putative Iron hydrogenase, large subunit [Septoria linicola]